MKVISYWRNLSFVLLIGMMIWSSPSRLFAWGSAMPDFCQGDWTSTECGCQDNNAWGWIASCDFSGAAEPLFAAEDWCDEAYSACASDCGSEAYKEYLADYECNPYYSTCDAACYDSWESFGCQASESSDSTLSCTCQGINYCIS